MDSEVSKNRSLHSESLQSSNGHRLGKTIIQFDRCFNGHTHNARGDEERQGGVAGDQLGLSGGPDTCAES